jgi:hypothetical protein
MSRGIRKICAMAAAVTCAAATLSACTVPGLDGAEGPQAAVSKEEASRLLNDYVGLANGTRKTRDYAALSRFQTGPQLPVDIGKYKIASYHRKIRDFQLDPLEFEEPTFFIPKFTGFPKWFAAVATPVTDDPALAMVFARATRKDPWRISYSTVLGGDKAGDAAKGDDKDSAGTKTGSLPRISLDEKGLATAIAPGRQQRSLIRPVQLPDAHASLNQYGVAGLGAGVVGGGPWTTAVAETVAGDVRQAKRRGFNYVRSYHASGFPIYALRTHDGGAVVWYSVTDELSVTRARARPRTVIRMANDMAGIIRRSKVIDSFQVSSLNQYVAVMPPEGGRAEVVGSYGGPVGGVGR